MRFFPTWLKSLAGRGLITPIWGLLLVLSVCQSAAADEFDAIREKVQRAIVRQKIPSVAIAVARDGKIIWEQGFGWADRERRRPATEHTMYSLASISKPITATGLMLLKERGKVELDKPANDYLGDGKLRAPIGDVNAATLRRVANHTAGLPMHYQFFYRDEANKPPLRDESIRRYGILVTEPGERYHYANLGYGVLDEVIARISGKSYTDFMREEVFLPLGLTHMSIDVGPGLEEFAAVRYSGDGLPLADYDFDHPGASAVYGSAHDLVRFGMFHLKAHLPDQEAILSDAAIDEMAAPTADSGGGQGYGVGWGTSRMRGHKVVAHSGGMPGVSTLLTLLPEHKIAIAVLVNSRASLPEPITEQIVKQLLPDAKQAEETSQQEPAPPAATGADDKREEKSEPPTLAEALAGAWEGKLATYEEEIPVTLWVLESGDMHLRIGRQMKSLVNDTNYSDGWLRGRSLGEIPTPDCRRLPHDLLLDLKHRGERITGTVTAISRQTPRGGNALPHWVDLQRVAVKEKEAK